MDPPYNTGNKDFKYNDEFVDNKDKFKHSKWLSFTSIRLEIAYKLLSNNGVIFISIDDEEQAQLKCLMNDIFGEDNFIIQMPRLTKKSGKSTNSFSKNHDYVLVYSKNNKNVFNMDTYNDSSFKYEDEYVDKRGKYKLNQTLDYDSLQYSASLDVPYTINNETFYSGSSKEKWQERKKGNHKRADWAWRWSENKRKFGEKNGWIVVKKTKDGSKRIYTKTYLNATIKDIVRGKEYQIKYEKRTKAISSIDLINNIYSNDSAKKDLNCFDLKNDFDYSKPVNLIKKL